MLASALTFDALLAMIPFGILLIGGLGYLLDQLSYLGPTNPGELIGALLPVQVGPDAGPSLVLVVDRVLESIRGFRSRLTLVAIPVFLWFASRVFGGMRVALSQIFQVTPRRRHDALVVDYLLNYFFSKLRDLRMIGVVLALTLLNTVLSAGISFLNAEGVLLDPPWTFFATNLGRLLAEAVAIGSALMLFALLYRYASPRRLYWRVAFLAGGVATLGFELAKRLFGMYLARVGQGGVYSVDDNIGAVLLFLLWIWYMALVFMIGAAAAKVWEEGQPPLDAEVGTA
ncbi:MAG: YihY/virulence factor BrkB family protein [Gemmatimonadales bacterium]|nr:YihY/virulence factor BrkB family protein [Gemmatimonadales bacterium]MDZ4389363.1 YihY/virulence factor BrkB family protein [Gemmatimonadales bacterium]